MEKESECKVERRPGGIRFQNLILNTSSMGLVKYIKLETGLRLMRPTQVFQLMADKQKKRDGGQGDGRCGSIGGSRKGGRQAQAGRRKRNIDAGEGGHGHANSEARGRDERRDAGNERGGRESERMAGGMRKWRATDGMREKGGQFGIAKPEAGAASLDADEERRGAR